MMVFGLSCIPKRPSGHSLPPRLLAEQLGRAPASLQWAGAWARSRHLPVASARGEKQIGSALVPQRRGR